MEDKNKDKTIRFPSIEEMLGNIENLEGVQLTPYLLPKIRTRRKWIIPLIAAGLLGVVLGIKACVSSISSRQNHYSNQTSYNLEQKAQSYEPIETKSTSKSLRIDGARAGWIDTGINIKTGDELRINASGYIDNNTNSDHTSASICSPNGHSGEWGDTRFLAGHSCPSFSLVGRIEGGDCFFVGTSYNRISETSGRLYLGFNDDYYHDNSGSFDVKINLTK